jgi:hypothetical protein
MHFAFRSEKVLFQKLVFAIQKQGTREGCQKEIRFWLAGSLIISYRSVAGKTGTPPTVGHTRQL